MPSITLRSSAVVVLCFVLFCPFLVTESATALSGSELEPETKSEAPASEAADQPHAITAETSPVVLGTSHRFASTVLGEERVLNIVLPPSYDAEGAADKRYPVVYLLDGAVHEDFHHVAGLVQFLATYQLMPESIVVGIANVARYHDFTHPTEVEEDLERIPDAGGSADFMRFLRREVRPYVESTFRTEGTSTLIGQSMGGLIASEIFIRQPDLFDQYIIVSPSLWWDDGSLIATIDQVLEAEPQRSGLVVVAIGTEGEVMQQGVDRFIRALRAHAPEALTWHYLPLPDETHATILHRAIYRSFELIYGESHPGL